MGVMKHRNTEQFMNVKLKDLKYKNIRKTKNKVDDTDLITIT